MPFRQIEIVINPGLLYAEQVGKQVKFVYRNLPTMYVTFNYLSDATDFFNDHTFGEGERVYAANAKGIELIEHS